MPETTTPNLQLRKPEVGGSSDTWGTRWNENADKIDASVGVNTAKSELALKKSGTAADRTMADLLLYAEGITIPPDNPNALVTQRFIKDLINGLFPIGTVLMWAGTIATIPTGWALCNGQTVNGNQTPNLSDRFLVQAGGVFTPASIGGTNTLSFSGTTGGRAITIAQMPNHGHGYSQTPHGHGVYDPGHAHNYSRTLFQGGYALYASAQGYTWTYPDGTTTVSGTGIGIEAQYANISFSAEGGGAAHDHPLSFSLPWQSYWPQFYAICYIMKVANA